MTRAEFRALEEAEVEAALRREIDEVQAYNAARRRPVPTVAPALRPAMVEPAVAVHVAA